MRRRREILVAVTLPATISAALGLGGSGAARGWAAASTLQAGQGEAEPGPVRTTADGVMTAADTLPRGEWHQVDRGTGILHFAEPPAWGPPAGGEPSADTIALRADPEGGRLVGWFVRERDGGVHLVQAAGAAVLANVLEYAYEDVGLPLDSVLETEAGSWARTLYGLDAAGHPARAWAMVDERLRHRSWRAFLPEQRLFMLGALELHDAPGGSAVVFAPIDDSYVIEPDSVAGDWLRARIASPHPCTGEPAARDTVAWLRFLDGETGRPLVWYHTRGC